MNPALEGRMVNHRHELSAELSRASEILKHLSSVSLIEDAFGGYSLNTTAYNATTDMVTLFFTRRRLTLSGIAFLTKMNQHNAERKKHE